MRKQTISTDPVITCWYIGVIMFLFIPAVAAQKDRHDFLNDLLHYEAVIEPDIAGQRISGEVTIQFKPQHKNVRQLTLDCGDLIIDKVVFRKSNLTFEQADHQLHIHLPPSNHQRKQKVQIFYHGKPRRGIQFFPEAQQVYTVFSTSQWMPSRDAPEERAGFDLHLVLPRGLAGVANGKLTTKKTLDDQRVQLSWRMGRKVPAYGFGFAVGPMNRLIERRHGVKFQYLSADYSEDELQAIFTLTPDMLRFFERRAGVKYPGKYYSQLLPKGNVSQEMNHFAVIRNNYGQQVLTDKAAIQLGAHELAHQWWGNQVTCRNWNHFWLNEGMAVFMASAYREYRFGPEAYREDMDLYRQAYRSVVDKGLDKPLEFPDWDRPTPEDRTLVYYKGACFFHQLREKLGERIFWKGIRRYTRKYFGKPVVGADLQLVMEEVSNKDLSRLFTEWVYLP